MTHPFSQTLISAAHNLNLESWRITSDELTPQCPARWSVTKFRLHGGKQEGVDVIVIDSGAMCVMVIPTRGMGVQHAIAGDIRLGWDSPVGQIVHPAFVNAMSRGGLGWLEGFTEFIARCGLEHCGAPGRDDHAPLAGEIPVGDLTLHGKIANIPASNVSLLVRREPPYTIILRGIVDERMLFGPKLRMQTNLLIEPGSTAFQVEDSVVNLGSRPQEIQLLYHNNFGPPLLEKGARLVAAAKRVTPINARSAEGDVAKYDRYDGPKSGVTEQVFMIEPYADRAGRSRVMLHNAAGDRGATITWRTDTLPCFTLWKNTAAIEDGYVTGLEPGTGYPYPRPIERAAGRVPVLKSGADAKDTFRTSLTFEVLLTRRDVAAAAASITRIQGSRKTTMDRHPPGV